MIAAIARRPFAPLGAGLGLGAAALQWGIVLLVFLVGLWGLLDDAHAPGLHERWFSLHTLFGLLLCAAIVARFYWAPKATSGAALDPCVSVRHLSRLVYLVLYCLIAARELVNLAHPANPPPVEAFQVYLAYGVGALVVIRLLGAVRHSSRRRAAAGGGAAG